LSLEDGLRQLCDTEAKGGGIWALRVEMQIDEQHQQLVIVDKAAAVSERQAYKRKCSKIS
jgi:hypothetical protein